MPSQMNYICDILICTKNRPEDIKKNLFSLFKQTYAPGKIIIVDASDSDRTEKVINKFRDNLKIEYIKSSISSTTYQRNIGIKKSTGNIIIMLDDDVVLDRNFILEIVKIYRTHPDAGGVSGMIVNMPKLSPLYDIFKYVFLQTGTSKRKPNYIKKSGFPSVSLITNRITEQNFMQSCVCSYKKAILNKFIFDENLTKYAYMEDVDISYRISKHHKLIRTPYAKLEHFPSAEGRVSIKKLKSIIFFNHYYLFKKNISKTPDNVLAHLFSHFGLIIECIGASIIKRDHNYITGCIEGYKNIYRHHKNNQSYPNNE